MTCIHQNILYYNDLFVCFPRILPTNVYYYSHFFNFWIFVCSCRRWLLSYLIFNACLYAGQLVLYSLLFLPTNSKRFLSTLIFLTLTIINFALPIILLVMYCYLSHVFAGFPYKGGQALLKLNKICKVRNVCRDVLHGWMMDGGVNGWMDGRMDHNSSNSTKHCA